MLFLYLTLLMSTLGPVLKLCQFPKPSRCCNSRIFYGSQFYPEIITWQLDQRVLGYDAQDTELEFCLPRGVGKLLLLEVGTSRFMHCGWLSKERVMLLVCLQSIEKLLCI